MPDRPQLTELEFLVRRIDEFQETYEQEKKEPGYEDDIRDMLINMLDRQVALLAGLIFDLVRGQKISQAEIDRLLGGGGNENKG